MMDSHITTYDNASARMLRFCQLDKRCVYKTTIAPPHLRSHGKLEGIPIMVRDPGFVDGVGSDGQQRNFGCVVHYAVVLPRAHPTEWKADL